MLIFVGIIGAGIECMNKRTRIDLHHFPSRQYCLHVCV